MKNLRILFIALLVIIITCFGVLFFSKNSNDTIQLWAYVDKSEFGDYSQWYFEKYIKDIKKYCEENNIELDLNLWGDAFRKPLAYDQYVLKRNIAIADGNAIILSTLYDAGLYEIKDMCMDYTKLDNYKNVWEAGQGKFYIPMLYQPMMHVSDTKLMESYNISSDKKFYTYNEYLDMFGELKENGADLRLNTTYYHYMVDYYKNINNILLIDPNKSLSDPNNRKEISDGIAETICQSMEELKNYKINKRNDYINFLTNLAKINVTGENYLWSECIYDSNTNYEIANKETKVFRLDGDLLKLQVVDDKCFTYCSDFYPGVVLYVYDKVTNEKLYDIVNKLLYNIKFNSKAQIPSMMKPTTAGNEEFIVENLEFVKTDQMPMHNIPAFRQHYKLEDNYMFKKDIKRTTATIVQEQIFNAMYDDIDRSREIMNIANAKSYINTQIDTYIRKILYEYIKSDETEFGDINQFREIQRADAEEFISKLAIHSN